MSDLQVAAAIIGAHAQEVRRLQAIIDSPAASELAGTIAAMIRQSLQNVLADFARVYTLGAQALINPPLTPAEHEALASAGIHLGNLDATRG